jgi:hypothetical protein
MPVGKKLAAERRSQGKTTHDIVMTTRIMARKIDALENGRWDDLPAEPYVKGYIQNYAQALGLDAKPFLEEYARDIGAERSEPDQPVVTEGAAPGDDTGSLKRIPERTLVPHRRDMHAIPGRTLAIVAAAAAVVILLLWAIAALAGRDDTPPPIAPETTATPTAPGVSTEATTPGAGVATPPEGSFTLAVVVTPGDSSWVRVLVDGLLAYEGTMPGGESKEWTVSTSAVVRAGKPDAVTITRDGVPVEMPDSGDEIAELTLSASE